MGLADRFSWANSYLSKAGFGTHIRCGGDWGTAFVMIDSLAKHVDSQGATDLERLTVAFDAKHEFHNVTLPLYSTSKGTLRWIMMRGRPQFEGTQFVGFRGIFADATKGVEAQKTG